MNETLGDALKIAIAAENAAARLFHGLEMKFAAYEDVALFWRGYQTDELKHAEWLAALMAKTNPQQLTEPADAHTVELMQAVSGISIEKVLAGVHDLEDAYQLVTDVENGETNAIFQFLLNHFETDRSLREFIQNQLNKHIAKLALELPSQYKGIMARRAILAK
jgi:hypothetical protein